MLAFVIDLQNTVQKSFICLICVLQICNSIQLWKQYLRTNYHFMSSLLYEISMKCPWRPTITQKLGEQLSWKCLIETTTCQRRVSVANFQLILLSMQINIYCLLTNQTPALLVQCTPWTQVAVMLVQSLYFSRPPPPRAIISNTHSLSTFENQDGHHLR